MRESPGTSFQHQVEAEGNRSRLNMVANDAFTNVKVPELRKFLKERGIQISINGKSIKRAELLELCKNEILMTSLAFQTSGFPIFTTIWLEKMATLKTVNDRIKVLRVFAYLLRGM